MYVLPEECDFHATVIPSRTTPFSSDHGRQTGLGQISTTLGDHAGISGAVAFWHVHPLP